MSRFSWPSDISGGRNSQAQVATPRLRSQLPGPGRNSQAQVATPRLRSQLQGSGRNSQCPSGRLLAAQCEMPLPTEVVRLPTQNTNLGISEKFWGEPFLHPAGHDREHTHSQPLLKCTCGPQQKYEQNKHASRATEMTCFFKSCLFGGGPVGHHLDHPELMNK